MTQTAQQLIHNASAQLNHVILGKPNQVRLALTALFAGGHLLLEDLPGMGKTTLAHGLANVFGLDYKRVQFTSDLLPADVVGATVFDGKTSEFNFRPGPIFSEIFLADELNRATPRAQSALLEAMEERQVSIDGESHHLPDPFFVIATQNPQSQSGTFPLPESQLDRFLLRVSLGYPTPEVERKLLQGKHGRGSLAAMQTCITQEQLIALQHQVPKIKMTDALLDYVQRLIAQTRERDLCLLGLSPRGALALIRSAQSWALIQGRDHVLPEDVQAVFVAVAGHRLVGRRETQGDQLARHILNTVDVIGGVRV
ncbi:AAA family ATPase [Leucothrix pacifica]|uniref:AAA family ATPase n=1 Tax=Leucothrix pacifica TaxID=1247513 RepID=A0A317C9W3_9GAMM|nr:MoxR family ATPase [Leucothrix pacifica]PWQ95394.1 AAA family ATPase [Leucothrix pacifica]